MQMSFNDLCLNDTGITIARMKTRQTVIIQYKVFIVIYCLYLYPFVITITLSSSIITTNIHEKP